MRCAGYVAGMGRREMHVGYWLGNHKEKPVVIPRHGWLNNIKMDLRGIGWGGMDWIDLARDRDQ
jgi:hypothetical protein